MDVFRVATDNIHDYTDTVSCYISWCTSICVPPRIYRRFPNQKPWFNQDIQAKIREQSMAFQSGNEQQYRLARYALLKSIRTAKKSHTEKLENCYTGNDSRRMWQGIQAVTNYKENKHTASTSDFYVLLCPV
ncbi:hypothetical protein N1851_030153 [Merluccius polli]|uniref:Uncharacterized protein n=1 Tax=Merluccius polli TaxID=89951 RepID=A0AA47M641_MERPO|nr:hypothetical protein N1851_030153 [Merluccius polli]